MESARCRSRERICGAGSFHFRIITILDKKDARPWNDARKTTRARTMMIQAIIDLENSCSFHARSNKYSPGFGWILQNREMNFSFWFPWPCAHAYTMLCLWIHNALFCCHRPKGEIANGAEWDGRRGNRWVTRGKHRQIVAFLRRSE